jgi:hypothetical protein
MEATMAVAAAVGGSIISGIGQSRAAKTAARAQTDAANRDIAFQTETRDLIRNDLANYRTGGNLAQQALDYELGLAARPMVGGTPMAIETIMPGDVGMTGGQTIGRPGQTGGGVGIGNLFLNNLVPGVGAGNIREQKEALRAQMAGGNRGFGNAGPMFRVGGQTFGTMEEAQAYANANTTGGTPYGGYTKTPGFDFRMKTGMDALQSSAAARGGLLSGAALRDSLKFGQDYGSNEYGNYLSRLGARADTGMSAATMSGAASQAAAGNISNAFGNIGNARSAGAIGQANALSGGIQNVLGAWNYQSNLNRSQTGGATAPWFGGGR